MKEGIIATIDQTGAVNWQAKNIVSTIEMEGMLKDGEAIQGNFAGLVPDVTNKTIQEWELYKTGPEGVEFTILGDALSTISKPKGEEGSHPIVFNDQTTNLENSELILRGELPSQKEEKVVFASPISHSTRDVEKASKEITRKWENGGYF